MSEKETYHLNEAAQPICTRSSPPRHRAWSGSASHEQHGCPGRQRRCPRHHIKTSATWSWCRNTSTWAYMELNSIKPSAGASMPVLAVGRGIGSGLEHRRSRSQGVNKSRSGGYHKVGFEGGQMPLQRRLPSAASSRTC